MAIISNNIRDMLVDFFMSNIGGGSGTAGHVGDIPRAPVANAGVPRDTSLLVEAHADLPLPGTHGV